MFNLFCLILWFGASYSQAEEQFNFRNWHPTYGAEFEFVKPEFRQLAISLDGDWYADEIRAAVRKAHQELLKNAFGKRVRPRIYKRGVYKILDPKQVTFRLSDGTWPFVVGTDVATIEINTQPSDLRELRRVKRRVNREVFQKIYDAGFSTDPETGSGQFNIGLASAFPNISQDPNILRAFFSYFIDFASHTELAAGIWSWDLVNAPPFFNSQKPAEIKKRFREIKRIIGEFLSGKIEDYAELQYAIHYRLDYDFKDEALRIPDSRALENLEANNSVIEIRASWPQPDLDHFILMAELFELRMRYLASQGFPLNLEFVNDSITDRQKLLRFHKYVTEAGGSFSHFAPLIHPNFSLRQSAICESLFER